MAGDDTLMESNYAIPLTPLISAFQSAWKRSFDYTGRSNRGDYWWFILANVILSGVLIALAQFSDFIGWLYSIWAVATIVPGISLVIRRLRDAGKHWGWFFIHLIPVIGFFWILYFMIQPSVA